MKAFIKRNIPAVCLGACLLIFLFAYLIVLFSADNGTYELRPIFGDPKEIDRLKIHMRLQDEVHSENITLEDGVLIHSTEYVTPGEYPETANYYCTQEYIEHENANVDVRVTEEIAESDDDYDRIISRMERATDKARLSVGIFKDRNDPFSLNSWSKPVQVITDVTVTGENKPFLFRYTAERYEYKNDPSARDIPLYIYSGDAVEGETYSTVPGSGRPLYATDGDVVYFTPALLPYHKGESAIYRVDEWAEGDQVMEPYVKDGCTILPNYFSYPCGKVTPVAAIPIDGEYFTISLDIVDGKLALLLVSNGMLTLRLYGLDGELQNEIPIAEYTPGQATGCQLFINRNGKNTMLCYQIWDSSKYDQNSLLAAVELGQKPALRSQITNSDFNLCAAYIQEKWVLVQYSDDITQIMLHPFYNPIHNYLRVLDSEGETLYLGEIATDAPEDDIQLYAYTNAGSRIPEVIFRFHRSLSADAESIVLR